MAFDETIFEQRREKLKQIEALGQAPYRSSYEFTHTVPQIIADFSSKTAQELQEGRIDVRVAGRIMAIRLMGKAGFAHIQQGGERLQIYVKKDAVGEQGFELYKLLDLGDHVGVSGYLFRTRTGELSVHVEEITFLSKDLLPLPEKWHGLTDVELRYRQRYVDLVMNPDVRKVFEKRSKLVQSMRRFLDAHDFIEVETPMMQPIAGGAVARPFVTHHNTLDVDLFLRIAPELYLKRLVVGGFDRVYEINRNFRNEGISTRHNPEFTMLEFYQAYTDFRGVMDVTQQLIQQAAVEVTGEDKTKWGDDEIDWSSGNWRRMTMREAIIQYWPETAGAKPAMPDFESVEALLSVMQSARQAVKDFQVSNLAYQSVDEDEKKRYVVLPAMFNHFSEQLVKNRSAGKTIADLFELVVEDQLVQPTIIYEFPAAVSPLSKNKPGDAEWVERFEIYAGKMEIANGFSELNDPQEQRRRFEQQLSQREQGDSEAHEMDEDYIRALSYGMPPAGGVGVGIDRLAMLLTDSHTIRDVILFPLMRPERDKTPEAEEGNPPVSSA